MIGPQFPYYYIYFIIITSCFLDVYFSARKVIENVDSLWRGEGRVSEKTLLIKLDKQDKQDENGSRESI